MKQQQRRRLLLMGGAVLVAAVIAYISGQYGIEFGKFFAAEPGVLASRLIRCSTSQTTVLSGKPVLFTAYLMPTPTPLPPRRIPTPVTTGFVVNKTDGNLVAGATPTPTLTPAPTRITPAPTFRWLAIDGNPARGSGAQFTTVFTNTGTTAVTKVVTLTYGAEQTTCSVSVVPLPPVATAVRVISPNGGESFFSGQTVTIQWGATGVSADTRVGLQLAYTTAGGQQLEDVITTTNPLAATGAYRWLIPSKYGGDAYKRNGFKMRVVLLSDAAPGAVVGDYSDAPFTITRGPTPTIPPPSPSVPPSPVPTSPAPSTPPLGYHRACIDNACTLVKGVGLDECAVDRDCTF